MANTPADDLVAVVNSFVESRHSPCQRRAATLRCDTHDSTMPTGHAYCRDMDDLIEDALALLSDPRAITAAVAHLATKAPDDDRDYVMEWARAGADIDHILANHPG